MSMRAGLAWVGMAIWALALTVGRVDYATLGAVMYLGYSILDEMEKQHGK